MTKMIMVLLTTLFAFSANAQLSNSVWKGMLNVQGGTEVTFNFHNDTLDVVGTIDNMSIETLKYSVADSVMSLQNIYGNSTCDSTVIGKYKYAVENYTLTLILLSDNCEDRANAVGTMKLEKQ